ncbi:MAG: hypothetical protein QW801_03285 [Candidatus Caldarchaeum sp.]
MSSSTTPMRRKELSLRVAEARQRDIGRKIARVDSQGMKEIDLSPGDLIEITGRRTTVAIVWPPSKEADGQGIIRIVRGGQRGRVCAYQQDDS